MQSLKELIERHADEESEFRYYIDNIMLAEASESSRPDVCIETCASLMQGISKAIIHRLEPDCDRDIIEGLTLPVQVRRAFERLKENDDVIELEFMRGAENLARIAGTLRNSRGDVSHGRAAPKELQSDRSLSRLVLNVTEAVLRYMLASYFTIKPEVAAILDYNQHTEFNNMLDELYPLKGKPLYSRALYDQFYEEYRIQLAAHLSVDAEADEIEEA